MSDHQDFRDTASELLQENGRSVTLSLRTTVAGAKPWEPGSNSVINLTVIALVFPMVMKDDKGTVIPGNFNGCFIASQDIDQAYETWVDGNAPSLSGTPTPKLTTKDVIVDGNREFRIIRVEEIKPGDQTILYELLMGG
jgi:hypothetical protein